MSLKHGLLGLLNYGQMTGYELDKAFKDSLNLFWQAQTSQIYRELNAMEKIGWLTSEIKFQTNKPNKKLYSITDSGKLELTHWLAENNLGEELKIRNEFLMKLFFSGEISVQENIAMLKAFKFHYMEALAGLSKAGVSIDRYRTKINDEYNAKAVYWELTAQFGQAYMNMCISFAEEAIKTLEDIYEDSRV